MVDLKDKLLAAVEQEKDITLRTKPTTTWQKADLWLEDFKAFWRKYWKIFVIIALIPIAIVFIYMLSVNDSFKQAIYATFQSIFAFVSFLFGFLFANIYIAIIVFVLGYRPAKRLLAREMISFCEVGGSNEETLTIRESGDEVVLYKDRDNWLATLIFGKKKVHTTHQLFSLLKEIGEERTLRINGEEYNFLRVYILPKEEVGEELFIKDSEGKLVLNTNFLIEKEDVEEFIIRHQHPDIPKSKLLNTFFNLEAKVRHYRRTIAVLENEAEEELERKFIDYVIHNTPYSYAKNILRQKIKEELKKEKEEGLPEELKEIIESYQRELEEAEEGLE